MSALKKWLAKLAERNGPLADELAKIASAHDDYVRSVSKVRDIKDLEGDPIGKFWDAPETKALNKRREDIEWLYRPELKSKNERYKAAYDEGMQRLDGSRGDYLDVGALHEFDRLTREELLDHLLPKRARKWWED